MNAMRAAAALTVGALLIGCEAPPVSDVVGPQFSQAGGKGLSFSQAGGRGPSATGHVERDLPPIFGVSIEKYSFTAHVLGNGEPSGRFEVRDVLVDGSESLREKGDVVCITVEADGKTARMGAVITQSSDGLEGRFALWTVRDNGEGANDPPDQATDLRWGFINPALPAFHCAVGFPPDAFGTFGPLLRANVQVRQ